MKYALCIAALVCVLCSANAAVISESRLSELGYVDFEVSGPEQVSCTTYDFLNNIAGDSQGYFTQYTVFSIHAEFLPVEEQHARVSVYLNMDGNSLVPLAPRNFRNGWARVELPREKLRENNSVKVCAETSYTTARIRVLSDSLIGRYLKPDFSVPGAFELTASNYEPKVNENFMVTATLKNYGSEGASINMRYRKQYLDLRMDEVEIVKGETSKDFYINECSERSESGECTKPAEVSISYVVKAITPVQITLLPAVAAYTNVFSEETALESSRPIMTVRVPDVKMRPLLIAETQKGKIGEQNAIRLAVKNEGMDKLKNISIFFTASKGLVIRGESGAKISSVMPGEIAYVDLGVVAYSAGTYEVGCRLLHTEYETTEAACTPLSIEFEQPAIDPLLVGGLVLLLIGAVVYAYIQTR